MTTLAQQSEPLRLITGEAGGGDPARDFWLLVALLGGVFIVSSCGAAYLWWKRTLTHDPSEYAFRAMARRLGIARTDRRAIRTLAQRQGRAPVALLVSPSALRASLEDRSSIENLDRSTLDRLRKQLRPA